MSEHEPSGIFDEGNESLMAELQALAPEACRDCDIVKDEAFFLDLKIAAGRLSLQTAQEIFPSRLQACDGPESKGHYRRCRISLQSLMTPS